MRSILRFLKLRNIPKPASAINLWKGVGHVKRVNIDGHQRAMISLYLYAMVLTGTLTLLPG